MFSLVELEGGVEEVEVIQLIDILRWYNQWHWDRGHDISQYFLYKVWERFELIDGFEEYDGVWLDDEYDLKGEADGRDFNRDQEDDEYDLKGDTDGGVLMNIRKMMNMI